MTQTYTAPTHDDLMSMARHERKAIYNLHKIARQGAQYRRTGREWAVAIPITYEVISEDDAKIGNVLEIAVRKQSGATQTEKVKIVRIADDERFAMATAYAEIVKDEIAQGVIDLIETIMFSDDPITGWQSVEDVMSMRAECEESDWQIAMDAGYIEERRGTYTVTKEGEHVWKRA